MAQRSLSFYRGLISRAKIKQHERTTPQRNKRVTRETDPGPCENASINYHYSPTVALVCLRNTSTTPTRKARIRGVATRRVTETKRPQIHHPRPQLFLRVKTNAWSMIKTHKVQANNNPPPPPPPGEMSRDLVIRHDIVGVREYMAQRSTTVHGID